MFNGTLFWYVQEEPVGGCPAPKSGGSGAGSLYPPPIIANARHFKLQAVAKPMKSQFPRDPRWKAAYSMVASGLLSLTKSAVSRGLFQFQTGQLYG